MDSTEKAYKSYAFAKEDLKKAVDLGCAVLQYITDLELEVEKLEGELENAKKVSDKASTLEFIESVRGWMDDIEDQVLNAQSELENIDVSIRELTNDSDNAQENLAAAKDMFKNLSAEIEAKQNEIDS